MKIARKDNLTDVVENLPKVTPPAVNVGADQKPQPQQQVVNDSGEVITLGQKNPA